MSRKRVTICREIGVEEFLRADAHLRQEIETRKQFESPWTTERIRRLAESDLAITCVATFDDEGATSCMLSVTAGRVAMMVTASTGERGRAESAGYLTYWESAAALRRKGVLLWNLGGIDEMRNRGVARFKVRGGGEKVELPGVYLGA